MSVSVPARDAPAPTEDARPLVSNSLITVFDRVLSTVRDVAQELPTAEGAGDVRRILLRGDRQIYLGVALLLFGVLLLLLLD